MNRLESYLLRATRGLWGKKRLEVMAELRGSLEARAWSLECQGYSPDSALETALLEMGAPQHISAGLMRTHTMPQLSKIGFALIAAAGLTVATLSSTQAQVGWALQKLEHNTEGKIISCLCGGLFINFSDLKTMLEKAGATVEESFAAPEANNYGSSVQIWDKALPVRTLNVAIQQSGQAYSIKLQALGGSLEKSEILAKTPDTAEFIAFEYVVRQLQKTKLPLKLVGWQRPTITLGNFSFTLERQGQMLDAAPIYEGIVENWWRNGSGRPGARNQIVMGGSLSNLVPLEVVSQSVSSISGKRVILGDNRTPVGSNIVVVGIAQSNSQSFPLKINITNGQFDHQFALRTKDPAGSVYAVISSVGGFASKPGEQESPTFMSLARTDARGILQFSAPFKFLEFGGNSFLQKAVRANVGTAKTPAQALLFRLTGRLDEGVKPVELVLPEKRKIMALK